MAINIDNINNFVDTKESQSTTARRSLDANFEDFLKLLTTQLQNQDPTAPTDTNQLTQQIATLSQVEQQINTNNNLEKLVSLFGGAQTGSMVSYIGKSIDAEGNSSMLKGGAAVFGYTLDSAAKEVTITVKNSAGVEVFSGSGATAAGRNDLLWNGKNSAGTSLPDGVYNISIKAVDEAGGEIKASTFTTGIVTSVDTDEDGVSQLSLDGLLVPMSKVKSVRSSQQENA